MEPFFAFVLYVSGHSYVADFNMTFDDCIAEMFSPKAEQLRLELPSSSSACVPQKEQYIGD